MRPIGKHERRREFLNSFDGPVPVPYARSQNPLSEMASMIEVNAVLFDADGVVQRAPEDVERRLTRALGGTPHDIRACVADFFAAEARAMTGGADFAELLRPILAMRKSTSDIAGLWAEWHTFEVDRSILSLIAELRHSGVYCALASNQEMHRARHMSDVLAYRLAFDREFYSCNIGHAKPSTRYFDEVIRLAGLDPRRTLFIDDRAENVAAARQAGLQAARFVLGEIGSGALPMRTLLASFGLGAGQAGPRGAPENWNGLRDPDAAPS
jgi:putative hydrolase of the HAD superfamily